MSSANLATAAKPADFLDLEGPERTRRFIAVDQGLHHVLTTALSGQRIVDRTGDRTDRGVSLTALDAGHIQHVHARFQRERMQSQGAWWLPDEASIKAALLNIPGALLAGSRFAAGDAGEDLVKVKLNAPQHIYACFALQPLFAQFFAPLELRGAAAGKKELEVRRKAWQECDAFYEAIGIALGDGYAQLRDAGSWISRNLAQRNEAKQLFLQELASGLTIEVVQRYRALSLSALVKKYYVKSKRVSATQRQVVNQALQPPLATYFAGSWLELLEYLGEEPSPDEEITTALADAKLFVGASGRVNKIAEEKGLEPAAVEAMLASFYGKTSGQSPVERRTDVCRRYWALFQEIHDAQCSGMPSLWGLIDDGHTFALGDPDLPYQPRQMGMQPYQSNALVSHVPAELSDEVEELWGTEVLARYPERIVSTPHPHASFAETFGPALEFWHGVSLTAWFICEGPYSRTTIEGMSEYYRQLVEALDELGSPIGDALFEDLREAESRLGEPQSIEESFVEGNTRISIGMGSRREGFEILRDVIARHRRQWTSDCFETYLRSRWLFALKQTSWELNRYIAAKGKQPTAKEFLKFGIDAVNSWFGGELEDAYAALGEKCPVAQLRVALMPANRFGFAQLVFERMGGKATTQQERYRSERAPQLAQRFGDRTPAAVQMGPIQPDRENWTLQRLADRAPKYIQLTEAIDRTPTARELGVERWLAEERRLEQLWPQYVSAIDQVLPEARALAPWRSAQSLPSAPIVPVPVIPAPSGPLASGSGRESLLKRLFRRV